MTSARASHRQAEQQRAAVGHTGRPIRGASVGVVISLIVLAAAIVAIAITTRRAAPTATAGPADTTLQPTGEVTSMGVPFVQTPGSASGTARFGPLQAVGSDYALGRVPLDVAVLPTWTITNTSDQPVELGEPVAQVREGCCPGPLQLGASTLAPGASTQLTFELAMHPGMDGWHDMGVYVPVAGQDGALELNVTGDFRN
jgi:hypothetical protein